jgi:hypothetical protein
VPKARNPLDPDSPLRKIAGATLDRDALMRPAADDEPIFGGKAWGL